MNGASQTALIILAILIFAPNIVDSQIVSPNSQLAPFSESVRCTRGESIGYVRTEAHVLMSAQSPMVVLENVSLDTCSRRCTMLSESHRSCRSFDYDSNGRRCVLRSICATPVGDAPLADVKLPHLAFFQQVCLGASRLCAAPYVFDRVPQHTIVDHAMRVDYWVLQDVHEPITQKLQAVPAKNVATCLRACLDASHTTRHSDDQPFVECRSAMFFYSTHDCFLSRETRRSVSRGLFTAQSPNYQRVDYFENTCHDMDCSTINGAHLNWLQTEYFDVETRQDTAIVVSSADECRYMCTENRLNENTFPCKAFIYDATLHQCRLSLSSGVRMSDAPTGAADSLPFIATEFMRGSNAEAFQSLRADNAFKPAAHATKLLRPIVPVNAPPEVAQRITGSTLSDFNRYVDTNSGIAAANDEENTRLAIFVGDRFYHEKICLVGVPQCDGASFEFVPNRMLNIRESVFRTAGTNACLERCLQSSSNCSSVMFFRDTDECVINSRTRFSDPDLFHEMDSVLYYDNLCQFAPAPIVQPVHTTVTADADDGSTTPLLLLSPVGTATTTMTAESKIKLIESATENASNPLLRKLRVVFKMMSSNIATKNVSPSTSNTTAAVDERFAEAVVGDNAMNSAKHTSRRPISPRPVYKTIVDENDVDLHTECRHGSVRVTAAFHALSTGELYIRDHRDICTSKFVASLNVTLQMANNVDHTARKANKIACEGMQLAPYVWSYVLVLRYQPDISTDDSLPAESTRVFNVTCDFAKEGATALATLHPTAYVVNSQSANVINLQTHQTAEPNGVDSFTPLSPSKNDQLKKYKSTSDVKSLAHVPYVQMMLLRQGQPTELVNLGEELELRWRFIATANGTMTPADEFVIADMTPSQKYAGHETDHNSYKTRDATVSVWGQYPEGEESVTRSARDDTLQYNNARFGDVNNNILYMQYGFFVENCTAERIGGDANAPPVAPLPLILHGCPSAAAEALMRKPVSMSAHGAELRTTLKAFRFEGSLRVRIRCAISVCVERCSPVQCVGVHGRRRNSYGRRKRRQTDDVDRKILRPPKTTDEHSQNMIRQSTLTGSYTVAQLNNDKVLLNSRYLAPIVPVNAKILPETAPMLRSLDRNNYQRNEHGKLTESHALNSVPVIDWLDGSVGKEKMTLHEMSTVTLPHNTVAQSLLLETTPSASTIKRSPTDHTGELICVQHIFFLILLGTLALLAIIQFFQCFRLVFRWCHSPTCQPYIEDPNGFVKENCEKRFQNDAEKTLDKNLPNDISSWDSLNELSATESSSPRIKIRSDGQHFYNISGHFVNRDDASADWQEQISSMASSHDSYLSIEAITSRDNDMPLYANSAKVRSAHDSIISRSLWRPQQTTL